MAHLHVVLDKDGPALLVKTSSVESVGKDTVWGGDSLGIITIVTTTFS